METQHSERRPGGTVDSWCGKCNMILAHTIEAMVGDKPARVRCNTCKSQHAYRANPPERAASKTDRAPAKTRVNKYQSLLKASGSVAPKKYSPQGKYEEGDVLEHPTLGRGITTNVKDPTKIEVLFETGSKTLVHGR